MIDPTALDAAWRLYHPRLAVVQRRTVGHGGRRADVGPGPVGARRAATAVAGLHGRVGTVHEEGGVSAELLRRAAKALRDAGEGASAGPWFAHPDGLVWPDRIGDPVSGSTEVEDADYIALMHPPVALALADLLDAQVPLFAGLTFSPTYDHEVFRLARAILRERP